MKGNMAHLKSKRSTGRKAKPGSAPRSGSAAGVRTRPTIEELERILASNEPLDIEIQPDGSIRSVTKGTANNADVKPITLKQAIAEHY